MREFHPHNERLGVLVSFLVFLDRRQNLESRGEIANAILGLFSRINDPFAINSKEANVTMFVPTGS